jgi:hypothetical protein
MNANDPQSIFDQCNSIAEILVVLRHLEPALTEAFLANADLSWQELCAIAREVRGVGLVDLADQCDAQAKLAQSRKPLQTFKRCE